MVKLADFFVLTCVVSMNCETLGSWLKKLVPRYFEWDRRKDSPIGARLPTWRVAGDFSPATLLEMQW
jgi:hypothetical protein